ncbi:hypothetical protein [Dokdonia sp.]|uniref:hypothetical protein n=1 Tax=Dokdonia sp. TaxID=2024995 RepID=UPI003266688B
MDQLNYKREQRSVIATIPVGSNQISVNMDDLPKGDRLFVGGVHRPAQDGLVRVRIDRNGDTILKTMDITWLDGGIGSFEQRAFEIADNGGSRLDVMISTTNIVATTDLVVELVFVIWINKSC